MSGNQNIFLVGPMGSGKSTIGRQLARRLKRPFLDSDHEIEAHTGASIALIFDIEGEDGFRAREREMIDQLTQRQGIVLATGGGAVLAESNRQHLHDRGTVIYLNAPLKRLLHRTKNDKKRPLMQTENPHAKLKRIVQEREPLYRETAHMIVHTDNLSVRQVVAHILRELKKPDTIRA